METQGTIGIKATLDVTEMQRNAQKYLREIDAMQDHTDIASKSVAKSFQRIQAAGAAYFSVDMAKRFASEMVSVYGTFQQLDISFKTMLQSGEKATKLMGELTNFAAITPFNLIDVGKGAKQLLAYGTKVENIKSDLEMLGNVASGVSVPLGDIIYLYGTLRSQGRAYAVDIRQFAGRGIPIYQELAKVLNVNVDEVNDLVEAGRVGFPQVEKAFQNMTNKGGMFFNLMQEQSKSVTGKISNLQDKIDVVFNELGKANDGFINGAIDGASYLVEHYNEIGEALMSLVAVYGIHKAALMANAAYYGSIKRVENITRINAEAQALKTLETEEIKANLSKQGLIVGSLEYNKALKAEIQAEMERQVQIAQTASAELSVAKEKLATAELAKSQALQNVQLKKAELDSVISLAQAEKVAAIEKRIALESEKQSNAALSVSRLQEQKDAAIKQAIHLKEIGASNEKIAANNREIAIISEKIAAAKAEEIQHSRNIVALRAEAKAVDNNISSKAVQKAQTQLNIATENLNTASIQRNTAAREVSSKAAIVDSAVRRSNTLETGLNTAGEVANTAAKSFGVKVTNLLTAATAKLNAVLAANVWTIVALGIAAVGYGIYKLITYQTDAEKAQEKLNKRVKEFNSETEAEQAEIDRLFGKLDGAKGKAEEYQAAKDAIIDKYGDYLKGLGDEIEKLNDVAAAYEAVSAAAKQAALDRAIADSTSTAQKDWADKQTELMDDLEKSIRESDKFRGKKGIDREVSAIMQMIKSDLKSGGKLSPDTQKMVDGLTKEYYVPTGLSAGYNETRNNVQVYVDRMKANNALLEKTYKGIHEKLGNDTNEYINLTAQQISTDIANFNAALERVKKTGRNQMAKLHDGSISSSMGEAEIMYHLRKLKEAQAKQEKDKQDKEKGAETVAQRKVRWAKELTEAEQKLAELKADNSTATEKEIKSQQDLVDGLKKKLGIDDKSVNSKQKQQEEANRLKVENAERQRQIDELNQQNKEKVVQSELELAQAKIDAMDEGFLKEQAQIELNYKKAKADNVRRANEYVKAAQQAERIAWEKEHPDYKEKGLIFIPTTKTENDLSPKDKAILESYDKAAFDAKTAGEKNLAKSLLETYQDYTDRRLAIEKKFNDDIAALRIQREKFQKEGNTEKVQQTDRAIAQATKKKGESLVNFDYEQLKKSPEYIYAFENLKQTSTETLNSLLSQLEDAKQTAAQVLSPDQLREYTSTIQSIMDELTERNPFQMLIDRKKELAEAELELAKAKQQLDAVNSGQKIFQSSKLNDATGKIEITYLSSAEALEKYRKAKDKAAKANSNFLKAEKSAIDKVNELASSLKGLGDAIGGTSGEIISLMGDVALFATGTIDGISKVAQTGANAISAVEKASVILGIISTAIQLLQKIGEMGSNKAFKQYEAYAEKIKEINALTDAVNEYRIAALEARQAEENWFSEDNLKNLRDYRKLHDEVAKAYADKAMESQAIYKNERGGGWLTGAFNWVMGNMSALSWWDKWKNIWGQGDYDKGQTAAINNLRIETRKKSSGFLGTGIGSKSQKTEDLVSWARNQGLGELFDDEGLINKELAQSLIDNYGDKLVGQTKETLEALIKLREQYDEYIQQLHEYVNSLYAPLVDNFVDSIWDWFDTGKDALDSFKSYASDTFRDIVSDMLRTIVLEKVVGSFSDDIASLYEEYSKGTIDEKELMRRVAERTGSLVDDYESNIPTLQNILNEVNGYLKNAGIDLQKPEESSREATKKGIATASQDSVDEFNGRIMATNIMLSDILQKFKEQYPVVVNISSNVDNIKLSMSAVSVNVAVLKELSKAANTHLANIENNTAVLKDMQNDMVEVKRGIERINDKGIKLLK